MWWTQDGERVLQGAEAKLFREMIIRVTGVWGVGVSQKSRANPA